MDKSRRYAPEVRERAVRLVQEHEREYPSQWAAIRSIAEKDRLHGEGAAALGRRADVDAGQRPGLTSAEQQRVKELERENRELRRANEILSKALLPSIMTPCVGNSVSLPRRAGLQRRCLARLIAARWSA